MYPYPYNIQFVFFCVVVVQKLSCLSALLGLAICWKISFPAKCTLIQKHTANAQKVRENKEESKKRKKERD